jgi:cysteine desulfurase
LIYLDHAATTPPRPEARAALLRWADPELGLGNASSAHAAGRRAREVVEEASERVAKAVGAAPNDVLFTSGGTEADNLAVKGMAWAGAERGRRHLVTTAVEHPAVLDACRWLATAGGFQLDVVGVGRDGRVDPEELLAAVRGDTALVAVMAANNELGTVNDVAGLGAALRERDVRFHVDAVQAFATLEVDVGAWDVDTLALSAHKFGGPGGVGVAVLRRGVPVVPLTHGGGQDRGVRSGTLATGLDGACAAAAEAAVRDRATLRPRLRALTDRLAADLGSVGGIRRNGPTGAEHRLASHLHVSVEGVDGEALLFALDQAGVCVSTGSACQSGANRASHVLAAAGLDDLASLRLSLGWTTTADDVTRAADVLTDTIAALRAAGGGAVA